MAQDDDDFKLRPGKPRTERGGGRVARYAAQSFERQVMRAVAKAGAGPGRIGEASRRDSGKTPRNGRYNAHGRAPR